MDTNNFEENIFIKGLFSVENKIKKKHLSKVIMYILMDASLYHHKLKLHNLSNLNQ